MQALKIFFLQRNFIYGKYFFVCLFFQHLSYIKRRSVVINSQYIVRFAVIILLHYDNLLPLKCARQRLNFQTACDWLIMQLLMNIVDSNLFTEIVLTSTTN